MAFVRKITLEEKMKILNMYTPNQVILLSGFLGSVGLGLVIIFLIVLLSFFTEASPMGAIKMTAVLTLAFSFVGMAAGYLRKLEFTYEQKFPFVYVFFGFVLSLFALLGVILIVLQGNVEIIMKYLDVPRMSTFLWTMFIFTIIFCCFTIANPLRYTWDSFYSLFLKELSGVDYRSVYDRAYFYEQVEYAFYNAKRYQAIFSLIVFKIENYADLKAKYNKRKISLIQNDIFASIKANIRETDIAGFLGEGEIFGITIFCGGGEAHTVADRILTLVESDTRVNDKLVEVKMSHKILSYSKVFENYKEMIRKAMESGHDKSAAGPGVVKM